MGKGRFAPLAVVAFARPRAGSTAPDWVTRLRAGLSKLGPRSLAASIAIPGKVIAAAAVLAVAGWIAGTQTKIISDFHELLPASLPELQGRGRARGGDRRLGLRRRRDRRGRHLTDPEVVAWMKGLSRSRARGGRLHRRAAATPKPASARRSPCPTSSATSLRRRSASRASCRSFRPTSRKRLSKPIPRRGRSATRRSSSFGIKVMPFDEQKELVDEMRALVDTPGASRRPRASR